MKNNTKNMCIAGVSLAIALLLPFITGQIPTIGQMLSPMHIPVLICGMLAGWEYGFAVGFISPLLRSLLFGMPAIMPNGVAMAFELAAYGLVVGIMIEILPKKILFIYLDLIIAMLSGRAVWGIARFIIGKLIGPNFTFSMFLSGAFITAIPGIILHLLIIPPVVIALRKALK